MLTLKKTGKSSLIQNKLPAQIQLQRLGLSHSSLTEDLGAYATAQVFLQATKSLASHETNPCHNVLLTPIEQLKTLYSMLRNIHDKNPFLLEFIEALKEAITYDGPTGDIELPSLVSTQKSKHAEQDTMTIVVDGREMTVLESTFIVSPNSVDYHGRKLTTKQDWISTLENLEAEGLWCAQTKGTQPAKILQKVSQITHDLPNDKRSNGKNSRSS